MKSPPTYYKVLLADKTSPTQNFNYAPYLPKNGKAGEWTPEIPDAKIREKGYYVSAHWNFWYESEASIFEVEVRGLLSGGLCGVEKQACCKQIRLLRDVTRKLLLGAKDSSWNLGFGNLGGRNIGNFNIGKYNCGERNTGDLNLGDFNTGDGNSGMDNVGDNNKGSANAGCGNIGHSNTGHFNLGSYNAGSNNLGNGNSGSFNKGSFCAGKWNLGKYQTGYFNTEEPAVRMFNKPVNLRAEEIILPKWLNSKDIKKAFELAPKKGLLAALALPNFDHKIFEEITGISAADFERRLKRIRFRALKNSAPKNAEF